MPDSPGTRSSSSTCWCFALAAGVIHGLMDNDLKKGLDYGAAMGALKHTIPGDLPWLTKDEIEDAMQGQGLRIKR